MSVQIIRLAGPTQVWPDRARYDTRPTLPAPTYSAVMGFLHACLGQPRPQRAEPWAPHPVLADASISVRVDSRGSVLRDFQIISPLPMAVFRGHPDYEGWTASRPRPKDRAIIQTGKGDAWMQGENPSVSDREYLADAAFTVFVDTRDQARSVELASALHSPVFTPFMGRKNSPPTFPWFLGSFDGAIETATGAVPAHLPKQRQSPQNPSGKTAALGPGEFEFTGFDVHVLAGETTTAVRTTSSPTTPLDRPGGRYSNRTVPITRVTAPYSNDLRQLMEWASKNLDRPAAQGGQR